MQRWTLVGILLYYYVQSLFLLYCSILFPKEIKQNNPLYFLFKISRFTSIVKQNFECCNNFKLPFSQEYQKGMRKQKYKELKIPIALNTTKKASKDDDLLSKINFNN